MFSAVYLVCFASQPCMFFVDTQPYVSEEVCMTSAEEVISNNLNALILAGAVIPEVQFQCLNWEKA